MKRENSFNWDLSRQYGKKERLANMFKGTSEVKLKDGFIVKRHALCLNLNKK